MIKMDKRIDALNKISSLMVLSAPLDEVLEKVMDLTLEITETDAGSLLLKEGNELIFKVAKGEKAEEVKKYRVKVGEGIVGYVAESKESLVVPDVSKDERFYKKIADDVKFKTYNIMATPIILDDSLLGVIEVINKLEKEPFTKDDLEILETISHSTALLLSNQRLKEELEYKAKALRTLVDVGLVLNSCHNMRELLDLSMRMATKAMSAEASSLMLIDEITEELVFEVIEGEKGEKIRQIRLQMGEGIAGWVAQNNKPLVIKDVSKDERFASHIDQTSGFKTKSIIAAPLKGKAKTIGVIEAINKIDKEAFDEKEIEFFTLLANQVALAIENARLYSYIFGGEPVKEEAPSGEEASRRLIGQVLKDFNLITEEHLQKALHLQKYLPEKKKIGEVLVEKLKVLTEDALNCALSYQLDIPYVTLTPTMIDKEAAGLLPLDFMRKNLVLPIMKFEDELSVVMADPLNVYCISDIEKITKCAVKVSLGSKANILEMIKGLFGKE
ncbi:MAG: GAF domain-containing protein [bacterium]